MTERYRLELFFIYFSLRDNILSQSYFKFEVEMLIVHRVRAVYKSRVVIRPSLFSAMFMRKYPFVYLSKVDLKKPFYGLKCSSVAYKNTNFKKIREKRTLINYFYFF